MPFDVADFPGASSADRAASRRGRRPVAAWLFVVAGMTLAMIGLGGATRLTGSGLSIMEWAPIMGAVPPMSEAEWHRLFDLYKRIPQFALINSDFQMADFQRIFWLEWLHRFWGRLIGAAFALPMLWFWAMGRLPRRMVPKLFGILALGGLQGAVGWIMVASGFEPDATAVSPYRLVVHLGLGIALFAAVLWVGMTMLEPRASQTLGGEAARSWAKRTAWLLVATMLAGGFVAGTKAGLDYNTFPLMDGRLVPDGYWARSPLWLNLTENIAAVQFNRSRFGSAPARPPTRCRAVRCVGWPPRSPRNTRWAWPPCWPRCPSSLAPCTRSAPRWRCRRCSR
jgi:cytochrome c oxidase assembly protein subunit 15